MAAAPISLDPYAATAIRSDDPYAATAIRASVPAVPPSLKPADTPGLFTRIQNSFDANTATSPSEPLLETGLKSVVGAIGSPFIHPLSTARGLATVAGHAVSGNIPALTNDIAAPVIRDYSDGGAGYAGTKLAGQTFGGIALGEAGGAALSGVKALPQAGTAIRDAAIGNTDAAALRGLRVPANSKQVLPMQGSINTARPWLQGVNSLEELQARVPDAKSEIWQPYQDAISQYGDRAVLGPDGPTTIADLENERLQLSALNRGIKSKDPASMQLAAQKGMTQADLLARQSSVESSLDPALQTLGIDPKAIRQNFGAVSRVGNQVAGKSTLLEEPQPFGLRKVVDAATFKGVDLGHPSTLLQPFKTLGGAARDIGAGRYWTDRPTDVAIREGFRGDSPTPNFGTLKSPYDLSQKMLPADTIMGTNPSPLKSAIVTPPPNSPLAIPAETLAASPQPMIGVKAPSYPDLFENAASTRIVPQGRVLNSMLSLNDLSGDSRGLQLGSSPESLRLPAQASPGELKPMIAAKALTYPDLFANAASTRIAPTTFAAPEIIPPRGFQVKGGDISPQIKGLLPGKGLRDLFTNAKKN